MRTAELTLPGFRHDVCSAIHPGAVGSPFLRSLPLEEHGLEWIHPPAPLAHPFDDGTAAVLERSVAETAAGLGEDGAAYRRLFEPLVEVADDLDRPAARAAPSPAAPARGGAVRGERASSRDHARQAAVRRRACAGALRRARRALDPPALEAAQRRGRARPGPLRARLRVAAARAAARRRSPMPSPRTCVRSAPRSVAAPGLSRSRSCRGARVVLLDVTPAPVPRPRRRTRCPPSTAGGWPATGTAPAPSSSTSRSTGRFPGRRTSAIARRPSTSAERWTRSPVPRPGSRVGGIRSARSSCSPSRVCSTPLGLRPASTPSGRIATSPTGRPST